MITYRTDETDQVNCRGQFAPNNLLMCQVHEYVSYKNERGDYEPFINEQYIICYNNIEVDRSEVGGSGRAHGRSS